MGAQKADPKGRNYDPEAEENEGPVHEVTLSPFMIAKYEVTQAQWKSVMGTNPSRIKVDDDQPVELVSSADIKGLNAKTGLSLPTEAQWEYACRGGTTTPFAGTGKLDDMGWYGEAISLGTTRTVGQKAPNGFGLYDMHGNVWEWCEDVYDAGFYGKPEAGTPDPLSSTEGPDWDILVIRGGGWDERQARCRSSVRAKDFDKNQDLGFRLAKSTP